ncbi:MAG: hypothetical protein IPL27_22715 [Lewinellaceae bacterium]|nr:hypothetical protein [Lewinellaceae bacterium]
MEYWTLPLETMASLFPGQCPQYRKILLSNDQSILVAGHEGSVFGGGLYATLRKFKPNGEVDSMFADNGIFKTETNDNGRAFSDIELQADNKIVAAGFWGDEGLGKSLLMRFFPDGKPDSTFGIYAMTRLEMEIVTVAYIIFGLRPIKKKQRSAAVRTNGRIAFSGFFLPVLTTISAIPSIIQV